MNSIENLSVADMKLYYCFPFISLLAKKSTEFRSERDKRINPYLKDEISYSLNSIPFGVV